MKNSLKNLKSRQIRNKTRRVLAGGTLHKTILFLNRTSRKQLVTVIINYGNYLSNIDTNVSIIKSQLTMENMTGMNSFRHEPLNL